MNVAQDITSSVHGHPLLICLTLFISYFSYYLFLHPLARFPGPWLAATTNLWKAWAAATDRMPNEVERLHARYGPVVRIGPNDLSFNTPEAMAKIYQSGWPKGEFYRGFNNGGREKGLFGITDEAVSVRLE